MLCGVEGYEWSFVPSLSAKRITDCVVMRSVIFYTRFLHDFVQNFNCSIFFARVEVGVSSPSFLDVAVSEAARYLLNVDSFVDQERGVGVPEIVYADGGEACFPCIADILIRYACIS